VRKLLFSYDNLVRDPEFRRNGGAGKKEEKINGANSSWKGDVYVKVFPGQKNWIYLNGWN